MAVEFAPIEVAGLKEALKELNDIDKKLRRQVTRDFKKIMQPVVADAMMRLPGVAPLSGMERSWKSRSGAQLMAWQPELVSRNIKAFTSGKKVRDTGKGFKQNLAVFGVRWAGPQAQVFDMAKGGAMGSQLTARFGNPSRVIYRAYELRRNEVDQQIKDLVSNVMRQVGRGGKI